MDGENPRHVGREEIGFCTQAMSDDSLDPVAAVQFWPLLGSQFFLSAADHQRGAKSDTGDFTSSISHTELLERSNLSGLELAPSSQGRGCLALQFGEHGLVLRSRRRIAGTHERPQGRQRVV
jgi:hypothetical protein